MSQPFEPPTDEAPGSGVAVTVVVAWMLAGAAVFTAIGASLQLVGALRSLAPLALSGAFATALVGAWARRWEQRRADARPAVRDARGRPTHPLRAWVFVAPVVVGVAGLLWLVVVASVRAGSLAPGVGFLVAGLGLLAVVRPLVTREVVTRALEALGRGDLDAAERGLRRIAGSRLASRASRAGASLNLALLALHRGDVDDAERWYVAAGAGAGAPWAATGLALCAVLRGRYDDAEQHLADAIARGRDRGVLREVDGVRALMVLRRDGAEAAAELGDRLISPEAGLLLRGVVAAARRRLGDSEGADVALGGLGRDDLVASGLAVAVPEIAEA